MTEELDKVKEVTYNNRARLDTHEALCALRYEQILEKLKLANEQIAAMVNKVEALSVIAVQSKTSVATILWLAGAGASVFTFLVFILKTLKVL